jgi:hypothetical protein
VLAKKLSSSWALSLRCPAIKIQKEFEDSGLKTYILRDEITMYQNQVKFYVPECKIGGRSMNQHHNP